MNVTDTTLEKAVFRILREHELEAYTSIQFRELQGLWAYTGLRQSDLRDALRHMFERNYLDFQNDGHGLAVVVTPQGYRHAQDQELHLGSLMRDTWDKLTLLKAGKRPVAVPNLPSKRSHGRRVDQAHPG